MYNEKEYQHQYYQKNKERLKSYKTLDYIKNKKQCHKRVKHYRKTHRKSYNKYQREYSHKKVKELRLQIINHYGSKCVCCGETHREFLAIDHKYKGGYKERQILGSGLHFLRHIIKNNYPDKYRILCHNCNMSRGFYGYCPHQKKGGEVNNE